MPRMALTERRLPEDNMVKLCATSIQPPVPELSDSCITAETGASDGARMRGGKCQRKHHNTDYGQNPIRISICPRISESGSLDSKWE